MEQSTMPSWQIFIGGWMGVLCHQQANIEYGEHDYAN